MSSARLAQRTRSQAAAIRRLEEARDDSLVYPHGGDVAYPRPFDLLGYGSTEFYVRRPPVKGVAFLSMASLSVGIDASVAANVTEVTYDSVAAWKVASVAAAIAFWVYLDRASNAANVITGSAFPDPTAGDATYIAREAFPLWYLTWDAVTSTISGAYDYRNTYHVTGM